MKYIILCLDGASDHPIRSLNFKTPLQCAKTPYLDRLARDGRVGRMQNTPSGFKAGSDVCNLSLLGYDATPFHTGRAPYEFAGMGREQSKDEIVFRCNLVSLEKGTMTDFSAGHISSQEASILIDALNEELATDEIFFHLGKSYRHILSLSKKILGDDFECSDVKCEPPHNIMSQSIAPFLPQGSAALFLNDLMCSAQNILSKHSLNEMRQYPANAIWLWSPGTAPCVQPFYEKFGIKGSVISAVDLVRGIGSILGMDVLDVPGITGYYDTDYAAKGRYALKSLEKTDCVFIHVEATDEAGHNGDLEEKIKAIENVDALILKHILESLEERVPFRILVAPDHPTPVELRTHTEEYVPFLVYGSGIQKEGRYLFDEGVLQKKDVPCYDCGFELVEEFFALK